MTSSSHDLAASVNRAAMLYRRFSTLENANKTSKDTDATTAETAYRKLGWRYWWWIVTAVVGLFTLYHILRLVRAFILRRKGSRVRREEREGKNRSPLDDEGSSHTGAWRAWEALKAVVANILWVQPLPMSIYARTGVTEWAIVPLYIASVLAVAFAMSWYEGKFDIANMFGLISICQLPLIVALAGRNNVLSFLTGISYERFHFIHRTAGRTLLITAIIHVASRVHKGLDVVNARPGTYRFNWGVVTFTGVCLTFLVSLRPIRVHLFEFFYFFHILFNIMILIGAYHHHPPCRYWAWPAMMVWGLDKFAGLSRLFIVNSWWSLPFPRSRNSAAHTAEVKLVDWDVVKVTLDRPIFRWSPGQHAYLIMPQIARLRYEQHPFAMTNVPDESGKVVFIIRAQHGFTRRLVDYLKREGIEGGGWRKSTLRTYIEGPYGVSQDMNHFDSVLLVAGGTGISFAMSHFLQILDNARKGKTAVGALHLVWNLRMVDHVRWVAAMLNTSLAKGTGGLKVRIDIHITRSAASDEPAAEGYSRAQTWDRAMDRIPNAPNVEASSNGMNYIKGTNKFTPDGHDMLNEADMFGTFRDNGSDKFSQRINFNSEKGVLLAKVARLAQPAAEITTLHFGRSHLERIVRDDVAAASTIAGGLGVSICGPTALAIDARAAVCKINSARNIMDGQTPIWFYSSNFGY